MCKATLGKVIKRSKAAGDGLALWVEHHQAEFFGDAANARDGGVAFPCGGMHQLALVDGGGEAQLVVVAAGERKFKAFVPGQIGQRGRDAAWRV